MNKLVQLTKRNCLVYIKDKSAVFFSSLQSPAINNNRIMISRSPVSLSFGSSRRRKSPASLCLCGGWSLTIGGGGDGSCGGQTVCSGGFVGFVC